MASKITKAQWRGMQTMRKQGKTLAEISLTFGYSKSYISGLLNGKYEFDFIKGEKVKKPKTIKQILKEERKNEEAEKAEREKDWCKIMCCNDRKSCMEIEHPENCLVWRLYNDRSKKSLKKIYLKKKTTS